MRRRLVIFLIVVAVILTTAFFRRILPYFLRTIEYLSAFVPYIDIVVTVVAVVLWFAILLKSDNAYEKIPWLLVMIIIPEIAILCYLSFGLSFRKTKRFRRRPLMHDKNYINYNKVNKYSEYNFDGIDDEVNEIYKFTHNVSGHSVFADNSRSTILNNGDEKFPKLIEKLNAAEKFIFMEYYVMRTDEIGKEIMDILIKKAKEGLEVKLMYDYFGGHVSRKYYKDLIAAGVEIVKFERLIFPFFNSKINYRLHRKITIIDGNVGFTGGLNLGDEYYHRSKKFGFWRDTHIMIEGPAVAGLTTIFLKDYYFQTNKMITDEAYFKAEPLEEKGYIQSIQSGPDSSVPIISQTYIKMINQAKESVKIVTPYISPSKELVLALRVAAMSGIDVSIIVPGQADKNFSYSITKSFFYSLAKSGVKIQILKDTFVHSKLLIIDDKIASIGTFNLDNRSESINFENTCIISNDSVKVLSKHFEEDLKNCYQYNVEDYKKESVFRQLWYALVNLVSPLA